MNLRVRKTGRGSSCGLLLVFAVIGPHIARGASADPAEVFSYQDYLHRDWTNELVRVPLSPAQVALLKSKPTLVGPDNQPVAYQLGLGTDGQAATIQFLANIKADQKASYKLAAGTAAPATDLKVEDGGDSIRITDSFTGVALRKSLLTDQGPVAQIKLASGKWVGNSRLVSKQNLTNYSAKVLCSGPVFAEVECRAEYGDGNTWVTDYRLSAGEPVVVVKESMALGDGEATFSLSLNDDFEATKLFYRAGVDGPKGRIGTNVQEDIGAGNAFALEPWLHWWNRPEEGPVFSLYRDDWPDMLSIGAGFASLWVDPKIADGKRAAVGANLMKDGQGLHLDFQIKNGRRQWIIATPDKEASLKSLTDPKLLNDVSLPHAYLIKYGQFPLNLVKDYTLDWANGKDEFPHLLTTKAGIAKYKIAHAQDPLPLEREIYAMYNVHPISQFTMARPLSVFFQTGDVKMRQYLVSESINGMQDLVDTFLRQPEVPYGSAPHHLQQLGIIPLVVDSVLDSPEVTPEQRKKLLAQVAFCSYAVNRPDFWSEDRGFCANPNMTTSVLGYRVTLGSLIASHPQSKQWVNDALAGLKSQLYNWSDENGGWLEAPHYAMVSYDAILGSAVIAHNSGLSDLAFDPRMRKVMDWFAKWSTPRDSRFGGFRHLPPVGNTYINEPTGEFGIMASVWKDKDPQYAGEMQWMYHQEKSWKAPGIGGGYPTLAGYREIMVDDSIKEKPPAWSSELFPQTGVVLRSNFPSDRETSLLLLQGSFGGWRSHWDDDSGSVTIWGKGRIVADDFGYYGQAPADDHSLPMAPEIAKRGIFEVQTFAPSKDFDYVSGTRVAWQRQISFLKNPQSSAPNFFVFTDTFKTANPAAWRMWFTANNVTVGGSGAFIDGKEDVDTNIYFTSTDGLQLKTEEKTRTANAGVRADGTEGRMPTTQIGLIASAPTDGSMTFVVYPRLKTDEAPVFSSVAGGKGVKIVTQGETDYVFQSATPIEWKNEEVSFSGKSGVARFRDNSFELALAEEGSISAGGQVLTAKGAARQEYAR